MMARRKRGASMPRKVVGYVRVSIAKQADGGHSIEAQRARLATYCELYDLELVAIHADEGASARSIDGRPGLADALEEVRGGRANGLLVAKLDRLSSSMRDLATLLDEAQTGGWAFLSVSEQFDTASTTGRLIAGLLGTIAQYEREAADEEEAA